MPESEIELVFDGGSAGNPGTAYGSFRWRPPGGKLRPARRLWFGHGTNNQAEYKSLIEGLKWVLSELDRAGLDPGDLRLRVRGDSRLVLKQIAGEWKVKNAKLRELRTEAVRLLNRFGPVNLIHQDRAESVRSLGH